jgi:hypothetical protein
MGAVSLQGDLSQITFWFEIDQLFLTGSGSGQGITSFPTTLIPEGSGSGAGELSDWSGVGSGW